MKAILVLLASVICIYSYAQDNITFKVTMLHNSPVIKTTRDAMSALFPPYSDCDSSFMTSDSSVVFVYSNFQVEMNKKSFRIWSRLKRKEAMRNFLNHLPGEDTYRTSSFGRGARKSD